MIFGKKSKEDIRDRKTEEEFLESTKSYQEGHGKFNPDRSQSIKLMLRGVVFFVMLLVVDVGFRKYRYTDSPMETVFFVLFLMSFVGALQFPIGMYFWIKNIYKDVPTNKRGR